MLAAAGSDGSIRLLGAESSKVVHRIAVDTKGLGPTSVTCLGWVSNIIRNKANWDLSQLKAISRKTGPEGGLDKEEDESSLDLPRDLSLIDIETSLPKLSPLPSIGGS
jgi:anaphase-promoting complex subunit 4